MNLIVETARYKGPPAKAVIRWIRENTMVNDRGRSFYRNEFGTILSLKTREDFAALNRRLDAIKAYYPPRARESTEPGATVVDQTKG